MRKDMGDLLVNGLLPDPSDLNNVKLQKELATTILMKELKSLLSKYDELYLDPIIRDNGDFLIPLHPDLKKNKEAQKRVADAFSEMMKADLSKKPKSKAWV